MGARRFICLLATASSMLTLALAGRAAAQSASSRTLLVFIDADAATEGRRAAVLSAVRADLADLGVDLQVRRASGIADVRRRMDQAARAPTREGGRIGALWLDLRAPDLLVFIANGDGSRALVRRIRVARGAEAAAVEETGTVVRSTVRALLEGRTIGMEPAEPRPPAPAAAPPALPAEPAPPVPLGPAAAPEPAPPPPPQTLPERTPPPTAAAESPPTESPPTHAPAETAVRSTPPAPTSRGRLRAGVLYVGTHLTSPGDWVNGMLLEGRYVARFRGYAGAGYEWLPPESIDSGGAVVRLVHHPFSLTVGYEPIGATHLRLGGELALVADVATRTSEHTPAGFQSTPPATRVLWALSPRARVELSPIAPFWLSVALGADIGLGNFGYVVPPNNTVAQPAAVRPRFELGLSVDLL